MSEIEAHSLVPFEEWDISKLPDGTYHRPLAEGLRDTVRRYTDCELFVEALCIDEDEYIISGHPSGEGLCPFSVQMHRRSDVPSGSGTIGLAAGECAWINIPEDVAPYPLPMERAVPTILAAVTAIMDGLLVEELHERGDAQYRTEFTLPTSAGVLAIDRSLVWLQLRTMFRRSTKRTLTYKPYPRSEA